MENAFGQERILNENTACSNRNNYFDVRLFGVCRGQGQFQHKAHLESRKKNGGSGIMKAVNITIIKDGLLPLSQV